MGKTIDLGLAPPDSPKFSEGFTIYQPRKSKVPKKIGQLDGLRYLNIHFNNLTVLPPEIGKLKNLIGLNLRRNRLTGLPTEIGGLQSLVSMHLDSNSLTGLPSEIGNLSKLRYLNLANNKITNLPMEITQLGPFGNVPTPKQNCESDLLRWVPIIPELVIGYNQICNILPGLRNWLDTNSYSHLYRVDDPTPSNPDVPDAYLGVARWCTSQKCQQIGVETFQPTSVANLLFVSPNPFNPTTTIRFQGKGQSTIRIYDLNGHLIRNWNQTLRPVVWNGQDLHGRDVASGTYIVRVNVGERVMSRRIVLMR